MRKEPKSPAAGVIQSEFARMMGTVPSTVGTWAARRRPRRRTVAERSIHSGLVGGNSALGFSAGARLRHAPLMERVRAT